MPSSLRRECLVAGLSFTLIAAFVGCSDHSAPPVPSVTHVTVPPGRTVPSSPLGRDATVPSDAPPSLQDPWTEAYPNTDLTPTEIVQFRSRMTSAASAYLRDGAAFILGRRAPEEALGGLTSVLPVDVQSAFVRGMAGRPTPHVLHSLPARFARLLDDPNDAVSVGVLSSRLRLPIDALDDSVIRRLLASDSLNDQIAGTLLLTPVGIGLGPPEMFSGLRPQSIPSLVKALAARADLPPDQSTDRWQSLLLLVQMRVVANPRAWGNAWVALRDAAPLTIPPVQEALRTTVPLVDAVTALPPAVLAALHCGNARVLDRIDHTITRSLHCAGGAEQWRSLATAVGVLGAEGTPPAIAAASLHEILRQAGNDTRVLEAIPATAVTLPPATARSILEAIASSRDPGVLAALLEQLMLHVQHARALTPSVRTSLLAAPFALPEAESIEARMHAIELAHALHTPIAVGALQSRGLQSLMNPDAGITPAVQSVPTTAVRGTLTLVTSNGRVVIQLRDDTARLATDVVVRATVGGRYNGMTFHRVVPGFVVQGGDPRQDGFGGTDAIVPTELSGERFDRGAVGIPLAGLDSGGMQIFIVTADSPQLDGRYPYIGHVIEGMNVVDELMVGDTIVRAEFTPQLGTGVGVQRAE